MVAAVAASARSVQVPRQRAFGGEREVRALADGCEMPLLGLGVWQIPDGPEAESAVSAALEAGYRHLDTAQAYRNEASVGRALAASSVPREEVFVTTKFFPGSRDPEKEAWRSLERLGIERLDLYLVHWPEGGATWAWPGMERALESGLTRGIGVSNFDVSELAAVVGASSSPPVVNQVEFSPFEHRRALLAECERHDVVLEAYSPLTHGRDLENEVVGDVARRNSRTVAQILLRWAVQRGVPVIPKSTNPARIAENGRIFDFALSAEDMASLDALDRTEGTGRAVESPWWSTRPRTRARSALERLVGRLRA